MTWHSLKIRFIAAIAFIYLCIGIALYLAFQVASERVIRHLGTQFAVKQALLEKSRVNASIQRDLSLSLMLAASPFLQRWVERENDQTLKKFAIEEAENYRRNFSDKSVFIVVDASGRYYYGDGTGKGVFTEPRYTLRRDNQNDAWYFRTMRDVTDFELNVDYDNHLDLTKVWFNVVIKNPAGKKIGMCGSGIDLTYFIRDIVDTKEEGIDTILLAGDGSITGQRDRTHVIHNSKVRGSQKKFTIYDLLSGEADRANMKEAIRSLAAGKREVETAFLTIGGKRYLSAMSYLKEIGWFNLVLLDLDNVISSRTFFPILLISVMALLTLILGIGLLVHRMVLVPLSLLSRSADAIAGGNFHIRTGLKSRDEIGALSRSFDSMAEMVRVHTENLERLVFERTRELDRSHRELAESNRMIMDSIRYAEMIQKSILPREDALRARVRDLVLFYRPRDIVGGDFYYYRECGESFIIAVADCTGHGVPGAFMSMTAKALIDRSVDTRGCGDPAELLRELDRLMRETLHQSSADVTIDSGLEIGLCVCTPARRLLVFAGAGIDLVYTAGGTTKTVPGSRQSIGYRRSDRDFVYPTTVIDIGDDMAFFLASDGILDQAGGAKGWGFGKIRFEKLVDRISRLPSSEWPREMEKEIADYQGDRPQRDDITVLGFTL